MTEYHDDPVAQRVHELQGHVNFNAVYLNGLVALLLEKGVITKEELRVHRLREVGEFDRVMARMTEAAEKAGESE